MAHILCQNDTDTMIKYSIEATPAPSSLSWADIKKADGLYQCIDTGWTKYYALVLKGAISILSEAGSVYTDAREDAGSDWPNSQFVRVYGKVTLDFGK